MNLPNLVLLFNLWGFLSGLVFVGVQSSRSISDFQVCLVQYSYIRIREFPTRCSRGFPRTRNTGGGGEEEEDPMFEGAPLLARCYRRGILSRSLRAVRDAWMVEVGPHLSGSPTLDPQGMLGARSRGSQETWKEKTSPLLIPTSLFLSFLIFHIPRFVTEYL